MNAARIDYKNERSLVKYVKIKKKRDAKLEKDFAALLVDEHAEIKKNIILQQQVRNAEEAVEELRRIATKLTNKRKQADNRVADAKDKLENEGLKLAQAKTDRERKVIEAKQEIFARAQAKTEIEIEDIEKVVKETNAAIQDASDILEKKRTKLSDSNARAEAMLTQQTTMQEQAKKLQDDDYADVVAEIERIRVKERYREVKPAFQNENEYIFLLVSPFEYTGDLNIKVDPTTGNPPVSDPNTPGENGIPRD